MKYIYVLEIAFVSHQRHQRHQRSDGTKFVSIVYTLIPINLRNCFLINYLIILLLIVISIDLKDREYCAYLPWIGTALAVGYAVYLTVKSRSESSDSSGDSCVNQCVQKENAKVVDTFDIEDMGNKTVFCRCWRSKKVLIDSKYAFL